MTDPRLGVQLFSVRGECARDLPATLAALAEIGYAGAEPWGYNGDALAWMGHPADAVRRMFDAAGLAACGVHLSTDALLGDNLPRTVEFAQVLGIPFLIVAMDKARMVSMAGIDELARILNEAAARLAPLGLSAGYHAHGFDAALVEGEPAWDRLFRQCDPAVVMQMDCGNYLGGGGDPIATLRRFPGRARSLHLKEFGAPDGGSIGEGQVDWGGFLAACAETQPVAWYVVEECGPGGMGFDLPRRAYQALRGMGVACERQARV